MNNYKTWLRIIIGLLFLSGFFIGFFLRDGKREIPNRLQDNTIGVLSSSLFVKNQSFGALFFDLNEPKEVITRTDIIAEDILQCESQNQMVMGDIHLPIQAFGVAQFQKRTFDWLKGLAKMPSLDYYKKNDQIWLLKWAIDNNYLYLWSCAYRLGYL